MYNCVNQKLFFVVKSDVHYVNNLQILRTYFKAIIEIIENLEFYGLEYISCNIKLLSMVSSSISMKSFLFLLSVACSCYGLHILPCEPGDPGPLGCDAYQRNGGRLDVGGAGGGAMNSIGFDQNQNAGFGNGLGSNFLEPRLEFGMDGGVVNDFNNGFGQDVGLVDTGFDNGFQNDLSGLSLDSNIGPGGFDPSLGAGGFDAGVGGGFDASFDVNSGLDGPFIGGGGGGGFDGFDNGLGGNIGGPSIGGNFGGGKGGIIGGPSVGGFNEGFGFDGNLGGADFGQDIGFGGAGIGKGKGFGGAIGSGAGFGKGNGIGGAIGGGAGFGKGKGFDGGIGGNAGFGKGKGFGGGIAGGAKFEKGKGFGGGIGGGKFGGSLGPSYPKRKGFNIDRRYNKGFGGGSGWGSRGKGIIGGSHGIMGGKGIGGGKGIIGGIGIGGGFGFRGGLGKGFGKNRRMNYGPQLGHSLKPRIGKRPIFRHRRPNIFPIKRPYPSFGIRSPVSMLPKSYGRVSNYPKNMPIKPIRRMASGY